MVCRWGMSDTVGPVSYHEAEESFLGRDAGRLRACSEATAVKIDDEISRLVREAHQRARQIVAEHRREVDAMAAALLKYEVLYASDVDAILAGGEITRDPANGTPPVAPAPAPATPETPPVTTPPPPPAQEKNA